MINLVEIKGKRIFFITTKKQFIDFMTAMEKNECDNSVIFIDNDLLVQIEYEPITNKKIFITSKLGRIFESSISINARKRNMSFINICEDKHYVSARYKLQMERFLEFNSRVKTHRIVLSDLRTGRQMLFEGDL